jgi:hypothetical protein
LRGGNRQRDVDAPFLIQKFEKTRQIRLAILHAELHRFEEAAKDVGSRGFADAAGLHVEQQLQFTLGKSVAPYIAAN